MEPYTTEIAVHWAAVLLYVAATIFNTWGVIADRDRLERISYWIVGTGLVVHGGALLYRWSLAGHGPYMARFEVLSSNAWVFLALFLAFARLYPKIRATSLVVFPASFLVLALALFLDPARTKLPPSLRGIWLVLHISFYKIAAGTLLIALALSILLLLRRGTKPTWISRLPDREVLDIYAYRFAGFGFVFWAIAMLAGSIWAHEAWGRFWGWDPIETWALIAWVLFGGYLHLRRFFGWKGTRAAWAFVICFLVASASIFFIPLLEGSIHSEYFK